MEFMPQRYGGTRGSRHERYHVEQQEVFAKHPSLVLLPDNLGYVYYFSWNDAYGFSIHDDKPPHFNHEYAIKWLLDDIKVRSRNDLKHLARRVQDKLNQTSEGVQ